HDPQLDTSFLLTTLGKLWLAGVNVAWDEFCADEELCRLPLPAYPFERQRYWVERREPSSPSDTTKSGIVRQPDVADWLYVPSWKRATLATGSPMPGAHGGSRALLFTEGNSLGGRLAQRLMQTGWEVFTVEAGVS